MTFCYKPSQYNKETKEQLWCSIIQDSHDCFCGCITCYAHLLQIIFPPDHRDYNKTIKEIIERDLQIWSSTGEEGAAGGPPTGNITTEKRDTENDGPEDDLDGGELEELIAAAESATTR